MRDQILASGTKAAMGGESKGSRRMQPLIWTRVAVKSEAKEVLIQGGSRLASDEKPLTHWDIHNVVVVIVGYRYSWLQCWKHGPSSSHGDGGK